MQLKIQNKFIGDDLSPFIIAEAGVNHNGSFELACELIRQAAQCNVDCIKFQTFKANKLVSDSSPKPEYQIANTGNEESQFDMLKRLEMPVEWYDTLISMCDEFGLVFLSTPYGIEDIKFLEKLNVPAYKVPSALLVEPDYLRHIAVTDKIIFLSTGMCNLADIAEAVDVIKAAGNDKIILLQCTTDYPSLLEDCNLKTIPAFRQTFNLLSGYSDHTESSLAAILAVGLGACVIERHFTLDKNLPGPDHTSSSTPSELKELVKNLRAIPTLLGTNQKKSSPAELKNKIPMRRSIVASCDIDEGTIITSKHLNFKRPAIGLHPKFYTELLGSRASKKILQDEQISFDDIQSMKDEYLDCEKLQILNKNDLLVIFQEINNTDKNLFVPHPFTQEEADKICSYSGKDEYVLIKSKDEIIAYGLLRGWDEGFDIPSLGIYVKKAYRNSSWAFRCMKSLHKLAQKRGAKSIRLSVFAENYSARLLYSRLGYAVTERNDEKLVLSLELF